MNFTPFVALETNLHRKRRRAKGGGEGGREENYKRHSVIVPLGTLFDGDKSRAVKNGDKASRRLAYRSIFTVGGAHRLLLQYVMGFYEVLAEWEGNFLRAKISAPNRIKSPFSP